jgi:tol-pal system protein YbgF
MTSIGLIVPTQRHIATTFAALLASLLAFAPAAWGAGPGLQLAQARAPQTQAQQPPPSGDSALQQRVDQLEEQLVDMQVVIGTLESLARGGGAATTGNGPPRYDSADNVRIDGLETQVRALAAQIEQLSAQVRALQSGPQRADAGDAQSPPPDSAAALDEPAPGRFGSTTVTAGTEDAIGGLIDAGGAPATAPPAPPAAAEPAAAAPADAGPDSPPPAYVPPRLAATTSAGNPKDLYETAYGYLMQRDYGAAQSAFEDFLNRYPNDSLAGNAQYWLGEALFVRGQYKAAAGAFLKGYKTYGTNARAADSLLKLAMSLDRLGQKDAACSSFAELSSRFPDAPDNVKSRAKSERQRIRCP